MSFHVVLFAVVSFWPMAKIKRKFTDSMYMCYSDDREVLEQWLYTDRQIREDCRRYTTDSHGKKIGWTQSPCPKCTPDVSALPKCFLHTQVHRKNSSLYCLLHYLRWDDCTVRVRQPVNSISFICTALEVFTTKTSHDRDHIDLAESDRPTNLG